ncbi:WD40 repeat-like protein [Polychaeton citri CBS 116435]|uniref:Pre-mRNA-processing factor 17 n=1 Tax=Polychaeton citri CBS 116435 TaxID=1314669 RepID=A0A9P4Q3L8_9PEZI|nr:WD40 repeat-like protein [Polychaeton citri CBS 116435]
MSLVPARNGANAPPPGGAQLVEQPRKTSTKGKVPTGYAEEIAISEQSFRNLHRNVQLEQSAGKKRKREEKGNSSVVFGANAYKGPWARFEEQRIDSDSGEEVEVSADESGEEEVVYEEDAIAPVPTKAPGFSGTDYEQISQDKETTTFEGSQQYDYQGRTYMHVPQDLDVDLVTEFENLDLKCFTPKKLIHTFKTPQGKNAHEKSLTTLRFFPSSGHLLLSAAADGKVKLWDVYHQRELLRTYSGHTKSVVSTDFTPSGNKFLSASYDRQMKVWDTETGQCTGRFSTGSTPHVIRWQPSDRDGKEFLAGMHDNKIVQFDTRADDTKPVQEYDHHLGPINTITFCDENRRFVTTSDDKSLRAWEYNIPVPIKFIAEPYMYPMVSSAVHPKGYILQQSSDNKIVVYSAGEKIRQNRKKDFRGHNNAGYKVELDVSPDGGIVTSGDSGGFVCFWDWKTCKMWHKIKASDGAVISTAWNPRQSSKVATGDINGVIKYWD